MSTIKSEINKIVKTRKQSKEEFSRLKERIDKIKKSVELFCSLKNHPGWIHICDSQLSFESKQLFEAAMTKAETLKSKIDLLVSPDLNSVGELERVLDRIERGEFHFCFMGAWRQGKSYVLDNLLDLGPYIAPNVNQGACTGTVVSILNNGDPQKTEAFAKYYTIDEMCNIINAYLSYFNFNDRICIDTSKGSIKELRAAFVKACGEVVIPNMKHNNSHESGLYDTLKSYLSNAASYSELLGMGSERFVIKDVVNGILTDDENRLKELRKRICFYDINQNPSFLVLAVKKVDVKKYFKVGNQDVGAVKFTDTCGIGEHRLGIDNELKRVILRDADIAVAVAKVPEDHTILTEVDSFHDLIASVLGNEEPSKWLYYLINKKNNIANDRATNFKTNINNALTALGLYLPEVNYQVVQPAQKDEINNFILQSILEPITKSEESIAEVDEILFNKTRQDAKSVIKDFGNLKEAISRIEVPIVDIDATKEKNIVNNIFSSTRNKVDELITDLSSDNKYADSYLDLLKDEFDGIIYSPYGYDMAEVFGMPIDDSIPNNEIPQIIKDLKLKIIQKLISGINGEISAVDGNELYEFTMPRQKIVLSIKNKFDNISDEYIAQSIKQIIDEIGKLFIDNSKAPSPYMLSSNMLGYEDTPTSVDAIINFANKHNLFEVSDFFKEYRDLQLPYMKTILNEIEGIIRISKLAVSLSYTADASQIAETFYAALLKTEESIKIELKKYLEELDVKKTILSHYAKRIQRIKTQLLAPTDQDGNYNSLNQQWKSFYKALYPRLFDADELSKLSQGYEKWTQVYNSLGIK